MKKRETTKGQLVKSYAEGIKKRILERNQESVKRVVGRKSGIYLLSKGERPYYIGLSNKLANRLKNHLDDKHKRKWDRFSFYSIGKKKYLKDVESMLVRIVKPPGNGQEGSFGKHRNLKKKLIAELKRDILASFSE